MDDTFADIASISNQHVKCLTPAVQAVCHLNAAFLHFMHLLTVASGIYFGNYHDEKICAAIGDAINRASN